MIHMEACVLANASLPVSGLHFWTMFQQNAAAITLFSYNLK